jgi:type VI secretion system secreted protein VgrG
VCSYDLYGDHFRDRGEGDSLARIRAEELMSTRVTYRGVARARDLHVGARFEVVGHPKPELDRELVVIELEHSAEAADEAAAGMRYDKRFVAIGFDTPYRPPRITPRPRIDGYVHGVIDSEDVDQDKVAPVDPLGQYTVVVPYDLYGSPGGPASTRRIRMAQPVSGNTNMHFPLDVGAEVAIVHLGGDPDRPLIVGSPPHGAARVSVDVAGVKDNRTQSVIETRNGIFIEFEDDW